MNAFVTSVMRTVRQSYGSFGECMEDSGARLTIASRSRLAHVLEHAAKVLSDSAKAEAMAKATKGKYEEGGVVYKEMPSVSCAKLDTRAVKTKFTKEAYPELYTLTERQGFVMVTIPKDEKLF